MIFAGEYRAAHNHFGEYAAGAPDVDFLVISPPREHDLWRTVVPCRNVAGHLSLLNTSQAKVAYF